MRENNDIDKLFRERLQHAEMEVRDGFWETLQHDMQAAPVPVATEHRPPKRMLRRRYWTMAASVALLLGLASWWLWDSVPENEVCPDIPDTVQPQLQAQASSEELPLDIQAQTSSLPDMDYAMPDNGKRNDVVPVSHIMNVNEEKEDTPISVHVSITIRQRQYGMHHQPGTAHPYHTTGERTYDTQQTHGREATENAPEVKKARHWALKASIGTSLPQSSFHAPLTADVSIERQITRRLSLEAGVQYNRLDASEGETLHTLGIPVKLNWLLTQGKKVDLYAQIGGMVEKCIAGAPDNSFRSEPVQGSVLAGLGVRYRLNDRLALFAEPSVSHHFNTDSSTRTLRTEQPVNINLLCGLRMTY